MERQTVAEGAATMGEQDRPIWSVADILVGLTVLAAISLFVSWATHQHHYAPSAGTLRLTYRSLPLDTLFSWLRMLAAYALSIAFTLVYAYVAAYNRSAERILIPLLDILQSIPVLSFLPVALIAMTNLFPGTSIGVNLASILLIFTGQVWNLTFALYTGLKTIPRELSETAHSLNLSAWQRFRTLELPSAMVGLVWNSMMSWAGGWFFLMAAEMFSLGTQSYQLRGIGTFLQMAANQGAWGKELIGIGTLLAVIVIMDQIIWRPLLAWAEKFKVEGAGEAGGQVRSTLLRLLRRSVLLDWVQRRILAPVVEYTDRVTAPHPRRSHVLGVATQLLGYLRTAILVFATIGIVVALQRGVHLISLLHVSDLLTVALATGTTLLRVAVSLMLSALWTVPVGVFIGLHPRWAQTLTPMTQIAASVPATALFPGLVALLIHVYGGLNLSAILLMMLGTQWYVLFNVIAGASAIPTDLREATRMFGLTRWQTWRTLILPAIYPYLLTGIITATGGAWNASIVAEYVSFHGHVYSTFGVGSLIARTSQSGSFSYLLLATLTLSLTVVLVNRLIWRRLYNQATERYLLF